ncbi:MAG: cytochrome-c peroxidase [Cyanothece sp. SIO1E1]|nr:cytochrome-c peroxidase [Cyanothece sp. SIO1E1]
MKKNSLLLLLICVSPALSCTNDIASDELTESTEFSQQDMQILSKELNLPPAVFNYANIDLPEHYKSAEANEADNTPDYNRITDMGATLGRVLFYDDKLSANNTISCASCHNQGAAFSDPRKFSIGLHGESTRRNSMTLINSRYYENQAFFWDERASTLEEQVLMPIEDHIEMGMTLDSLERKLQKLAYYQVLFRNAFGSEKVTSQKISLALSQFTRSIVSYNSKFDEGFIAAGFPEDEEQMPDFPNFTRMENLGMDIFYRGRNGGTCLYCHGTPQHVNDIAKNNGLDLSYSDKGKGEVTGRASDNGLFKVPSLRNIAKTAPYMHDGRFETLREVVDHYSDSVQNHPNLNFRLKTLDDGEEGDAQVLRLRLSEEEKEALIAFLHTLTDEKVTTEEKYSDPFIRNSNE